MNDLFGEIDWIYERTTDNKARYVLGKNGKNPLICIGVNPSIAEPGKLDPTLMRVNRFAARLGHDGWIMLNLYPQRATKPDDLHESCDNYLHRTNKKWIYSTLGSAYISKRTIWAAWGALIEKRTWLAGCLRGIVETGSIDKHNWITIGKRSRAGHPHHPLYLRNDADINPFDVHRYLEGLL